MPRHRAGASRVMAILERDRVAERRQCHALGITEPLSRLALPRSVGAHGLSGDGGAIEAPTFDRGATRPVCVVPERRRRTERKVYSLFIV